MSLLNIIVASSNITCLIPLYLSFKNKDTLTFFCTYFVSFFSFTSHLFENHKHGMSGIKWFNNIVDKNIENNEKEYNKLEKFLLKICDYNLLNTRSKKFSYILNRLDVLGCILCVLRYFWIIKYNTLKYKEIFLMIIPLIFSVYSEYDKYDTKRKNKYVISHCIWHLCVFTSMGYILYKNVYVDL